jgi:hypothetical protein
MEPGVLIGLGDDLDPVTALHLAGRRVSTRVGR